MQTSAINFNKELLFAEIGAFLSTNITTLVVPHLTKNNSIISGSAVVAAVVGGSAVWLFTRFYDRKKHENIGARDIAHDVKYFTPFAFFAGILVYDPALYFVSNFLLRHNLNTQLSVIVGQVSAFILFLTCMNIYRIFLIKQDLKRL